MASAASGANLVKYFFYEAVSRELQRRRLWLLLMQLHGTWRLRHVLSLSGSSCPMFQDLTRDLRIILCATNGKNGQEAITDLKHRSALHNTTSAGGKHVPDPKGWHVTIAFKTRDQDDREVHVASHGYTIGKDNYTLKEATHTSEKSDSFPRGGKRSGKVVWPGEELLEEYEDSPIAHSHLSN
ncbi:hypothetical protein VFPPC_17469 [Pochonia chlamydosporia 170]|uniref:Uncharacterized protein n=1 Tax=Pochonia chlamydosporia 170 TaxID=1380566 RepID=A0A219ARG0_METCM|nr:hypothetical protein VFPPC_17469 [Pochonia chlamydosporia 170]OWT43368.1 hypothetical protein VFPPC_17469 [Pochonia chlamydosporia 170]